MTRMIALLLLTLLTALPVAAAETPLRIACTEWSSSQASAHVVQALLQEHLAQPVELVRLEAAQMWQAVATGEADVLLSAWLPTTHADYLGRHGESLVDLGPNLVGARIGLVVADVPVGRQTGPQGKRPTGALAVASIADLAGEGELFRNRIIGIDPEAGIMARTREAMAAYGLEGYRLVDGSEVSMTAELSHAIRTRQPIVVTGWSPHWMFARWNLRFLDDPKGIFGGAESIHTLVRPGLAAERPEVVAVLDRFSWTAAEMGRYLVWNHADRGLYPYEKALRWLYTHPEKVAEWLGAGSR